MRHAVINHKGELPSIEVTAGNLDDRKGVLDIAPGFSGKLYAHKGCIGKAFAQKMEKQRRGACHTGA